MRYADILEMHLTEVEGLVRALVDSPHKMQIQLSLAGIRTTVHAMKRGEPDPDVKSIQLLQIIGSSGRALADHTEATTLLQNQLIGNFRRMLKLMQGDGVRLDDD